MRYLAVPFLFFILSLSFCAVEDSSDVNQDRIYQDLEVFYNSNTDKTTVVARFRFGNATGTLLELKSPAQVEFNNEELPFNILYSGHAKEYAGQLNTGTFVYTNIDGDEFTNSIPAYEAIQFPDSLNSISKSQSYDFKWDGTPLSDDQHVGLFIGSWVWGQDALFAQAAPGANNIVLGTDGLSGIATGTSTCYMDRATAKDVDEGTSVSGRIRGKFRANNIQVDITE